MARRALLAACALLLAGAAGAEEFFDWELRLLGLFSRQGVNNSLLNPGNVLGFPKGSNQFHIRPDLFYRRSKLDVSAKPRLILSRFYTDTVLQGTVQSTDNDAFMNEWFLRYRMDNSLFFNVGRENLQWGPSTLLSPSNPFLDRNGRNLPQFEVPGLDYVRTVWVPNSRWTLSGIANVGEGRFESFGAFQDTYAMKLDWTVNRTQASVIASHREGGRDAVGFYGLRHVSEALLAYVEGSIAEGRGSVLGGGAYTFKGGETLTLEYFHDGRGLLLAGGGVPVNFSAVGSIPGLPNQTIPAGVGRHEDYAMVAFRDNIPGDTASYTIRLDQSLEGGGSKAILLLSLEERSHLEFFLTGNVNFGGDQFGFGAFTDELYLFGAKYTF